MTVAADRQYLQSTRGEHKTEVAEYNFANDGGAIATFSVFTAKSDVVITSLVAQVKSVVTSSGSPAIDLGDTQSAAVFRADDAKSVYAAGAVIGPLSGTLPRKLAAGDEIIFKVKTAALTAGKVDFVVGYQEF